MLVGLEGDRALFDAPHGRLVHQALVVLVAIRIQSPQIEWTGTALVLHHAGHQVLVVRTDFL